MQRGSAERSFYSEYLSPNEQILEFNRKALELASMLDGNARRLKLEVSKDEEETGYKVEFQPMEWFKTETGEKREGKKKKEPEVSEPVESESQMKVIGGSVPAILEDYNLCLILSSNRSLAETPESGLLTEVSLEGKKPEGMIGNGEGKILDLWVSLRDGIQERANFQSYCRTGQEQNEWIGELAQVNKLLGEAIRDLKEASEAREGGEA